MKKVLVAMLSTFLLLCSVVTRAQQSAAPATSEMVPPLVSFSGALTDANGKAFVGPVGVTFSLYKDEQGGAPLWVETQNVQPDKTGHYSVMLGSTSSQGIPSNLFVSGEAHWLGVQAQGQAEPPRVLLLSVPYALKAVDAETVGGLPPSAFVLAVPPNSGSSSATSPGPNSSASPNFPPLGGKGTTDFLPLWINSTTLGNSVLFQSGVGAKAKVGIGTTKPASTLDVKGGGTIRGLFSLPVTGTATAKSGFNSQPMDLAASVFNSGTSTPVTQTFRWQAEPVGNDTGNATGSLNLLFGQGSSKPAETGLNIASNGQITFATGQTFPGAGTGTVTSVSSGLGLTGGPITSSGTLTIDTTVVPQLAASNTFTGNQTVNGNLSATGVVTGSSFAIGSNLFAFGSFTAGNALLGFAGNSTMTGGSNTATGQVALFSNTTGAFNTASGASALRFNTTGSNNVANGVSALLSNTTGSNNSASGFGALDNNTTGGNNTASGGLALFANTTGTGNTANGADALEENSTGGGNTANGYQALFSNTTASENTANGFAALFSNTTGTFNTANGYEALYNNTTASLNTADGVAALTTNTTGSTNTGSGFGALTSNTTGSNNTAFGGFALSSNTTGSTLTCVGAFCNVASGSFSNSTAIGAYASINASNALVLGSTAAQNGAANILVGVDVSSPTNILTVLKGGGHAIADGWDTYSSRRWKTNIQPLQNALGLVNRMRGVSYELKESGKHEIGVIAEEVGEVVPEVVSYEENGKDARGVDYSRLTALLIEAVKQQQRQIKTQQQQIVRLNGKMRVLEATLQTVQHMGTSVAIVRSSAIKTPGCHLKRGSP
jgi:hypothetical protein